MDQHFKWLLEKACERNLSMCLPWTLVVDQLERMAATERALQDGLSPTWTDLHEFIDAARVEYEKAYLRRRCGNSRPAVP